MRQKKPVQYDNPEQSKRFIDMAHEVGVDESTAAFDQAFDRVIKPKTPDCRLRPSEKRAPGRAS
jgi:hypothetical protein